MKRKAKKAARQPAKKKADTTSVRLSAQHERFCHEYIADYHQTKAALRAGYSEKSAAVTACRLLKKDKILARVRELQDEQLREMSMSPSDVLYRLNRIMRREETEHVVANVKTSREFYDEKGKRVKESVEVPTVVQIPTKIFDATKAAELLGKHLRLFEDQEPQDKGPTIIDDIPDPGCVANG